MPRIPKNARLNEYLAVAGAMAAMSTNYSGRVTLILVVPGVLAPCSGRLHIRSRLV